MRSRLNTSQALQLNLNVPLFTPSPMDHAPIPIHLAALILGCSRWRAKLRKESVASRLRCKIHFRSVDASHKAEEPANEVCLKPLVATAQDEGGWSLERKSRGRLAFFYRHPLMLELLRCISCRICVANEPIVRTNQWSEMSKLVSDELLEEIVIVALYDELASKIKDRFRSVLDRIEVSIPINNRQDEEVLSQIIVDLRTTKWIPLTAMRWYFLGEVRALLIRWDT